MERLFSWELKSEGEPAIPEAVVMGRDVS
ncbi:hypothetical protein CCP3SC5AM1_2820001 [Gammaproteobacteria bacterium]